MKKKEVTELQIELPVPCFFANKEGTNYIGMLDEKTVIEIVSDTYEMCIRNFNAEVWKHPLERVKDAYLSYHSCTESQFLDKYSEVERAMSLHPILVP